MAEVKRARPVAYWRCERIDDGQITNEMGGDFPLTVIGGVRIENISDHNAVAMLAQRQHGDALACENVSTVFNGDYTFEAWAFPEHVNYWAAIVAYVHSSNRLAGMMCELRGALDRFYTPRTIRYLHRWPLGTTGGKDAVSQTRIMPRRWYHIATVRQQGRITLYVNGKPESTVEGAAAFAARDLQLVLGRLTDQDTAENSDTRHFTGYLDEVAIYDRALTPDEIRQRVELIMEQQKQP